MKIVVDAFPVLLRSAGVKTAIFEWIKAMRACGSGHEFPCFPFFDLPTELDHERSPLSLRGTAWRLFWVHHLNHIPPYARNLLGPRGDLFHISIHMQHPPTRTPISTTIHDMTCWLVPETHTPANVRATKSFAERVYPLCRGLLAVSEATRRDACRILSLPEDKVEVIPNGVAPAYFDVSEAEAERVRSSCSLPRNFVLYVGTIEPRKNIGRLLNAWEAIPAETREGWEFVLAGPIGWDDPAVVARVNSNDNGIRYLGYVSEADLPGLFGAATVFAYPSLYEGFGLPAAQALAARVPVLTSNLSSLPEVCGDGALYVDPLSECEIRDSLRRLMEDGGLRESLRTAGRQHVAQYTWPNAALKSVRFFERIAG